MKRYNIIMQNIMILRCINFSSAHSAYKWCRQPYAWRFVKECVCLCVCVCVKERERVNATVKMLLAVGYNAGSIVVVVRSFPLPV